MQAANVGNVTAQTTRMNPNVLKHRFLLQPGDEFSPQRYEQAQEELHKLRVFKKLDFSATPQGEQVDIHIRAQDGYYLFPMAFYTGGSKSAGGASLWAGNLFKQGENTFLFGGGSKDGWMISLGWVTPQTYLSVQYKQVDLDPRFYQDGWFNIPGVFTTQDDKKHHRDKLLEEIKGTQKEASISYKYRFSRIFRGVLRPEYKEVSYQDKQLDSGRHHQLGIGLEWANDIRPGLNMGALAGYGLTDKRQSLQNLPHRRAGYDGGAMYAGGGNWTDSQYTISKLSMHNVWFLELKTRHLFMVEMSLAETFKGGFTEQVTSTDLLSRQGRYDRQRRGKRGGAISTSFAYYLLRNNTGLLSLTPFYEIAYVRDENRYRPHSGTGATLAYRLWRFPLPFGINYTHNLQDGSDQVGFVIGGAF